MTHVNRVGWLSYFLHENSEVSRGEVWYPRTHSGRVMEPGLKVFPVPHPTASTQCGHVQVLMVSNHVVLKVQGSRNQLSSSCVKIISKGRDFPCTYLQQNWIHMTHTVLLTLSTASRSLRDPAEIQAVVQWVVGKAWNSAFQMNSWVWGSALNSKVLNWTWC